jgi:hypothetical protein
VTYIRKLKYVNKTINCLILHKDHFTDLSNGYTNIVNNELSKVCKIKVKETRTGKSRMDKPDTQAKLDTRHRTKTMNICDIPPTHVLPSSLRLTPSLQLHDL